jgi:DNA-binding transcriptional MerR regulator
MFSRKVLSGGGETNIKDYLTIKEFSKFSGIDQTALRDWDEIGLFSPAKRDPDNKYRYYSPEQIISINFITVLSGLSIPLKTISRLKNERTPESLVKLLEQQERQLDMEIRRLHENYSVIHVRSELIKYGMQLEKEAVQARAEHPDGESDADESSISVLYRDDMALVLGPPNVYRDGDEFYQPFMEFCKYAEEIRVNLSYPIGGYHDSLETFMQAPSAPERFFSLDPTGTQVRSAGYYLVGSGRGYYGKLGDFPQRMEAYAKAKNLTLKGPVYVVFLHDEVSVSDPSRYLFQVSVAVV